MVFNSFNWKSCLETVLYRFLWLFGTTVYHGYRSQTVYAWILLRWWLENRNVFPALYSCLPGSSRSSGQNMDEDVSEEVISGRWWRLLALASQGLPCIRFRISWLLTSIRASAERLSSFALCSCACEQFSGSVFSAPTGYGGQ